MRLAAAVVPEARLQCYVDDPVVVASGKDRPSLRLSLLLTCLLWQALGAKLAWEKMQWGAEVSWIGFELLSPSSCAGISLEKLFKKSNFDVVGCQMFEPSTVFFMAVQSGEHPLVQSSKDPINIINPGWNQWENHRVLLGVLTIQDL